MMTYAQIGGRHGTAQVARFLTDTASNMRIPFVATSGTGTYNLYNAHTLDRVFVGSADDALEFLEKLAG
jgi:hypothetical protein